MADDLIMNPGSGGSTLRADQLLTGQYVPFSKIMDGTADSTQVWVVDSSGRGKMVLDAGSGIVTEDTASAGGEVSVLVAGVRNDTAAAKTSTDGDFGNIALDSAGRVGITDLGGTISIDDGAGSITVDGSVGITGTATTADSQTIVDNAAFTDGTSKVFMGGYILDEVAGTALTENDAAAARVDSKRAQVHVIEDATTRGQRAAVSAAGAVKVDGSGVTQPVSGTVTTTPPANAATNLTQIAGTAPDVNSGLKSAGTLRVVLATDQPALTAALKVDPSAVTSPISAASLPLPTGAATAAKQPALGTAGTPSADVITVQGAAGVTALATQQTPGTTGGYLVSRLLSAATTNATSVKASAGQVYGWMLFNTSASTKYLKLYNKASAPTVGTDTPFMTIPIPAGGGEIADFDGGIAMGTGVAFAVTGGIADSDATAVAVNDVVVNLLYK